MTTTMSRDIPVELIDADPEQPRRHFDAAALQELADSLAADGQIVPITVRSVGDRFVIVQGERRWRAAQLAGLPTLRVEVADVDADRGLLTKRTKSYAKRRRARGVAGTCPVQPVYFGASYSHPSG